MSGPLRSREGCWTCKLRKKKCDERRPQCSICESLLITCYGYGPKPDWMDSPEEERAVANGFKEIVKHTSRRKALTTLSKRRDPISTILSKASNVSLEDSVPITSSSRLHVPNPALDDASSSSYGDGASTTHNGIATASSSRSEDHIIPESKLSNSSDHSALLMHFLDHIFPLQFPLYKPGILQGGRGWLLSLILRTQPLYHAVLASSAYHRRTTMIQSMSRPRLVAALVQQEQHLEDCLRLLNEATQHSCPSNGLGMATAVVQLLFFELFTGHENTWQPHLRAAINMYQRGNSQSLARFGLAEVSRTILLGDLSLPDDEPSVAAEIVNFRFLSAALTWLDIISSITAGVKPQLSSYHQLVLAPTSQTKLQDIMGCDNRVMLLIGRIATLHEHSARLDSVDYEQVMREIKLDIQSVITELTFKEPNSSNPESSSNPSVLVTRIFTYMSSIYLHLVTWGFQELEMLDTTISEAMRMLQTPASRNHLSSLVCPLYIIGSVARENEEQFFRDVFSSPPLLDPALQHRVRILPILEEIWSKRRTTPGLMWKDSLELTTNVLLI